jgi:zinc protease
VKDDVINGFMLKMDSTRDIASVISMMMRDDLGQDYIEKRAAYFEDVKCKDIQEAARAVLTPDAWLFVVVGGEDVAPQDTP